MRKYFFYTIGLLLFNHLSASAQSTFGQVHAVFQTKCTPSCHSGTNPSGNLDLSGSLNDVYTRLINIAPTNPTAAAKNFKLVEPGYPFRSFLMKKVNQGLDSQNTLAAGEGGSMPGNQAALSKEEQELIRQWIIWGAKDTGVAFNSHLIHDYYNGLGVAEIPAPITPGQEGKEGFQVKFGPVFLEPNGEFEYFQAYNPRLQTDKEITTLRSVLPAMSHHWVLRSLTAAGEAAFGAEPMEGANIQAQILVYQHTSFMAIWQFSDELSLPEGTAHFQDSAEAFLLNLHVANYSADSIIAAVAYLNVYTQPRGSGAVEMKTGLAPYGGLNPFILQIPNTGMPYTLQEHLVVPGEVRYIWNIQSHTHALGTDYDMFLRNPDGTKGTQIYEGFFNSDYSFNQGYYDYAHPAVRTFDPMLEVDMNNGLIFEATWVNSGPDTVGFGLTTKEEMFVTYFSYTSEMPSSIRETEKESPSLFIFPNPGSELFNLRFTVANAGKTIAELYNSSGDKVKSVFEGVLHEGSHALAMDITNEDLPSGFYFVKVSTPAAVFLQKIVVVK